MSGDQHLQAELLRRFQALKSTPTAAPSLPTSFRATTEEQARRAKEEDEELERIAEGRVDVTASTSTSTRRGGSENDEMRRRIARLRGEAINEDGSNNDDDDDDAEVEAFIASLSMSQLPDNEPAEPSTSSGPSRPRGSTDRDLKRDARDILNLSDRHLAAGHGTDERSDDGKADEFSDLETEEEILARAIGESRLERSQHGDDQQADTTEAEGKEKDDDGARLAAALADAATDRTASSPLDEPELSFPSLPSHAPVDKEDETEADPIDPEIDARMAMLLGLSGPRSAPGPPRLPSPPKEVKRKPGQGWNLPGYKDDRDDDPDSWCCICNKDAEVICLGCDNDSYCESCWIEGHTDERHRTKRFAAKGGRRAVGA